jgi:hypothetical protein
MFRDLANLVLQTGGRVIQPGEKNMLRQSNEAGSSLMWGTTMRKITLRFAFDVAPEDLQSPVEAILIDGDGNRHEATVDLGGVLNIN